MGTEAAPGGMALKVPNAPLSNQHVTVQAIYVNAPCSSVLPPYADAVHELMGKFNW